MVRFKPFVTKCVSYAVCFLCISACASATDVKADAASQDVEKCGVVFTDPGGATQSDVLPSLHVISQTAGSSVFVLPPDAPSNVESVQCGRYSLIPEPNDYKVLAAGYPLAIVAPDGERVGILEAVDGQLRFRMLEGKMTESELVLMQAFLDQAQDRFNVAP